jgi:hypothetical protein
MNHINPARSLAHGLGVGALHEPSESSAKTLFVRFQCVESRQLSGLGASVSTDPA